MTLDERLETIFRQVLGDERIELTDDTAAVALPGWDSLAAINTMFSVEEAFGVQFAGDEFVRIRTIGELKDVLAAKGVHAAG